MNEQLRKVAEEVRDKLAVAKQRIVFAESCTGGNLAATLAQLPGISSFLCGGFVVYRNDSKSQWLHVPKSVLEDPGPVSSEASKLLAQGALKHTPEADVALAITGDLGPGAPDSTDGKVFIACQRRGEGAVLSDLKLAAPPPQSPADISARSMRLDEATYRALSLLLQWL